MKTTYVLEYKTMDKKGRLKNASFAGVFKDLDAVESKKSALLSELGDKISFQVYINNDIFAK